MKRKCLWKLAIDTTLEAEDVVGELLFEATSTPVSSYTDLETGITTVAVYLEQKPKGSATSRELAAGLERIRGLGLSLGSGRISLHRIRREDWAESWKRHFKAMSIVSKLLVKPSWVRRQPRKGQAVVVLDPGLSFGTGQHPTTEFCLRQLVARRRTGGPQSVLDIGTGSGILAIAAAKLGYGPVEAFDFDPESLLTARANAKRNRVLDRIRFSLQDVTRLPKRPQEKYTVICANLISNLLLAERDRIVARLEPGGVLVLAGILESEFSAVQAAYETTGLRLVASRSGKEWRSGSLVRSHR